MNRNYHSMQNRIYESLVLRKSKGQKSFAVLVDPDKVDAAAIDHLVMLASDARVDYFLVGGSLVISNHLDEVVQRFAGHAGAMAA